MGLVKVLKNLFRRYTFNIAKQFFIFYNIFSLAIIIVMFNYRFIEQLLHLTFEIVAKKQTLTFF
jgi:hypothetical protein